VEENEMGLGILSRSCEKENKKCKEFVMVNLRNLGKYIRSNKRFSE
jgi:hypothetical protein